MGSFDAIVGHCGYKTLFIVFMLLLRCCYGVARCYYGVAMALLRVSIKLQWLAMTLLWNTLVIMINCLPLCTGYGLLRCFLALLRVAVLLIRHK